MLKVEDELDQVIVAKTYEAEQEHVFRFWDQLDAAGQRALLDQLATVDFRQLSKLTKKIDADPLPRGELTPIPPVTATAEERGALEAKGWEALKAGRVACLVVAGGQGTRLGWPKPKGTYPVGPVTGKSLYQLFAEQVRATGDRAGKPLDIYVLTSALNRAETEAFFAENDRFGLSEDQLTFLTQADLPNTDFRGKLLMAGPGKLAMSPNGHGGTFLALQAAALERMAERGQDYLFYWQIDNPLCRVADPVFLGAHIEHEAEASTKVVRKEDPSEKIGILALRAGKTGILEYSEMSDELKQRRDDDGALTYRGGNTAIHVFSRAFLERLTDDGFKLGYHIARKAVATIDDEGQPVQPDEPNAAKFETFIFDLLAESATHLAFEVTRDEEFEPLKNADGPYSPETVKRAQSDRAKRWLVAGGFKPDLGASYEISPLTALDPVALGEAISELPAPQDGKLAL